MMGWVSCQVLRKVSVEEAFALRPELSEGVNQVNTWEKSL